MKCRAITRIMQICMVLVVVVSAFFYAPMEVSASTTLSNSFSQPFNNNDMYGSHFTENYGNVDLYSVTFPDSYYELNLDFTYISTSSTNTYLRNVVVSYGDTYLSAFVSGDNVYSTSHSISGNATVVLKGSELTGNSFVVNGRYMLDSYVSGSIRFTSNFTYNVVSCNPISSEDGEDFQNGYNHGYTEGLQDGYNLGFSDGYESGEESVNIDKIFNDGYQAGQDSVNTEEYYQAGYNAGYDKAYVDGFESGFDEGYQSAMDRVDGWGADTANYPLLVTEYLTDSFSNIGFVDQPYPRDLVLNYWVYLPLDYNPSHTYKFILDFNNLRLYRNAYSDYVYHSDITMSSHIGSGYYPIRGNDESYDVYYIAGDRVSDTIEILWTMHNARVDDAEESGEVGFKFDSLNIMVYDMGPSGDTQNHIANQTDQLTNGYDSSQGSAVNDDFKASVNEYHTAEDSLFSTATSSLENFTFLDFTSITGMVTSLSFVTSIMTSIYMAMGGDTGASGIVLAVLFSVMLVSMAIGLYRYYVSNGKSNSGGKGGD